MINNTNQRLTQPPRGKYALIKTSFVDLIPHASHFCRGIIVILAILGVIGASVYSQAQTYTGQAGIVQSSAVVQTANPAEPATPYTVLRPVYKFDAQTNSWTPVRKENRPAETLRWLDSNSSAELTDSSVKNDLFQQFHGKTAPVESAMINDARDGRFDRFSLLEAALIAGGTTDTGKLESYKLKYNYHVKNLSQIIPQRAKELIKARAILEYLHREMFKQYELESSNVGAIFDSGIYNCVTGATLFNLFARQFGLQSVALELPGHAMSRVFLSDGSSYDVETTCAIWFQLQNYPGKQEQVIERMLEAGAATQVAGAPVVRRQINDVELVAKLYYNRGVALLNLEDYLGALQCNAKALSLDSSSFTAKGNFLATLNNWAIAESKDQHYAAAMNLLRQGMKIDPQYPIFKNNHIHIYHQWIEQMCKQSRFDEALRLSRQAISEAPNEEHFKKLEAYAIMGLRQQSGVSSVSSPAPVSTTVSYPHQ